MFYDEGGSWEIIITAFLTDGSVYTVGFTGEDIDFGTGNIEGSSYDGFVLKLTSSGSIE